MSERVLLSSAEGLKGSVTTSSESELGIPEDGKRNFLCLNNTSADPDEVVWLGFGVPAAVGEGVPLAPGNVPFVMQGSTGIYTGDIYFIAKEGTPKVAWQVLRSNI